MSKLAPIYSALDSHQYNRAIKLASALPKTHILGRALLAHAYAKSGQRHKALSLLSNDILGDEGFPELQLELKYSILETRQEDGTGSSSSTAATTTSNTATASSAKKGGGGKKGKKKPPVKAANNNNNNSNSNNDTASAFADWDWIDQLDTPPSLPEHWEDMLPTKDAPRDRTLLATVTMTLVFLRLPLTAYQVYAWAIRVLPDDLELVRQTFVSGLTVWVAPQYPPRIMGTLLASLQVTALQVARLQQETLGFSPFTAWAAQTALWQLDSNTTNHNHNNNTPPIDPAKAALLPRLAESLACKAATQMPVKMGFLVETEHFLLYMRALAQQGKWSEQIQALQERLDNSEITNPRDDVLRQLLAEAWTKLQKTDKVRSEVAMLLQSHPDNWDFWKLYLTNDDSDNLQDSMSMVETILEATKDEQYPLRGPHLARIEGHFIQFANNNTNDLFQTLISDMMEYADLFATRASCTMNDLSKYVDYILENGTMDHGTLLLEQSTKYRNAPSSEEPRERRQQLRGYIFGIQMAYRVVAKHDTLESKWLPDWKEILQAWKDFQSYDTGDQAQKENRPADELILLAVQQLTRSTSDRSQRVLAATILENAIVYSPDNAYLKISAVLNYGKLDAVQRSWTLFRQLFIKHIQHESCAYLILPLLHGGAFYHETISVCQEILRQQTAAIRDSSDFTSRAIDTGTLEKANEFIMFQKNRMNKSLTTLEAKGRILDCAPMFHHQEGEDIGALHGVIGGPDDQERIQQMIVEAHNPHAAFSLLRLKGNSKDNMDSFTENRDLEVTSYDILGAKDFSTSEQMISESIRRSRHHSLLIRASLCLDATKGPKKGKVAKNSAELTKRSLSLLASVEDAISFSTSDGNQPQLYKLSMNVMTVLSRVITAVSAGRIDSTSPSLDTLDTREEEAAKLLSNANTEIDAIKSEIASLPKGLSVSQISKFIPDCLVAIYALFQMCGRLLEVFGWGKRKRGTRASAAALATLSVAIRDVLQEMKSHVDSLPSTLDVPLDDLADLVRRDDLNKTQAIITECQLETKRRIDDILLKMAESLKEYDVEV